MGLYKRLLEWAKRAEWVDVCDQPVSMYKLRIFILRLCELNRIPQVYRGDMAQLRRHIDKGLEELRESNEIVFNIHPDAQNTNFIILLGRHGKELAVRSRTISQEEFDGLFETLNKPSTIDRSVKR